MELKPKIYQLTFRGYIRILNIADRLPSFVLNQYLFMHKRSSNR
uniref:ORF43c n=1 Tax=Pinus koraiensis TaxID=88728 RepID=Q85WU7_PINKO|nr:ORF43c [Pinus koraiensis]AAO74122.1 ORF43c [Pinus koraiensis]